MSCGRACRERIPKLPDVKLDLREMATAVQLEGL
jgi:hypothetical protein